MYLYKLLRLTFNDDTTIEPGKLTVIIGPNNSGKSRLLKELVSIATSPLAGQQIILKSAIWTLPSTLQELRDSYEIERYQDQNNSWLFRGLVPNLSEEYSYGGGEWPKDYEKVWQRPTDEKYRFFAERFGKSMIAFLTTEHRLQMVKEANSQSHERETANLLQALYTAGRSTEHGIRELVKDAFAREIALDFTLPHRLQLRIGDDFSNLPLDPRDARPILTKCEKLDEQGDGIRSFVGVVVALLSVKRSLFLIDEPEAFLHPPQAFRIGHFLASQASDTCQMVIATHSADVLRGLLSKTRELSILRIDRLGNCNYFTRLDPERLKELVNDPLLSSARVLDGLFYSGAIVVEADSDARFYHVAANKRHPNSDVHFVNADNKQTVPRITELYRDMGVRCAGIVDFDVLNNRVEFEKQLKVLSLNPDELNEVLRIQDAISQVAKASSPAERLENAKRQLTGLQEMMSADENRMFDTDDEAIAAMEKLLQQIESRSRELSDSTKRWKQFKQAGRSALPADIQVRFDQLWGLCAGKGLFINPCGELESLLTEYGIAHTSDKRAWIVRALQLLPQLEVDDQFDLWNFVKAIQKHLGIDKPQ